MTKPSKQEAPEEVFVLIGDDGIPRAVPRTDADFTIPPGLMWHIVRYVRAREQPADGGMTALKCTIPNCNSPLWWDKKSEDFRFVCRAGHANRSADHAIALKTEVDRLRERERLLVALVTEFADHAADSGWHYTAKELRDRLRAAIGK